MTWYKPSEQLPTQGYKVLCQSCGGDYYVAQRLGKYWCPIPFLDAKMASLNVPDYWCHIDFIPPNTGYVRLYVDGRGITIDEAQESEKQVYEAIISATYDEYQKHR